MVFPQMVPVGILSRERVFKSLARTVATRELFGFDDSRMRIFVVVCKISKDIEPKLVLLVPTAL